MIMTTTGTSTTSSDNTNNTNKGIRHAVSVKATYWLPNHNTPLERIFEQTTNVLDVPPEPEHLKTTVIMPFVAGSVEYSGRHDHGVLDIPKQRRRDVGHDYDDIAMLVACCDDAKAFTNEYLTSVIQTEEEEELIMRKQQQQKENTTIVSSKDDRHEAKRSKVEISDEVS